ncbi:MAG: hypothetical protein ACHQHN_12160 [Sphingobacteriales bacterium]
MKKSFFAFLLITFSLSSFAQQTKKDLIGKWEGTDKGNEKQSLTFKDNGKVILDLGGRVLNDLDYKIELTKTPAPLDIIIKTLDGKQQIPLKCFIQFMDNNTLKWQIFAGGDRPNPDNKSLSSTIALNDAITIILKRKKT